VLSLVAVSLAGLLSCEWTLLLWSSLKSLLKTQRLTGGVLSYVTQLLVARSGLTSLTDGVPASSLRSRELEQESQTFK